MCERSVEILEEELLKPSKSKTPKEIFKNHFTLLEKFFGIRHLQAVLLFFMIVIAYGMRVNLSVTIVAMTDPSATTNPNIPVCDD